MISLFYKSVLSNVVLWFMAETSRIQPAIYGYWGMIV